jgi:hypothetical protein
MKSSSTLPKYTTVIGSKLIPTLLIAIFSFWLTPSVLRDNPDDYKKENVAPVIGDSNNGTIVLNTVTPSVTSEYFIRKELATGCFDIDSVDVAFHIIPVVTSIEKSNPTIASCPDLNNGSITITATGANLRYSKDAWVTF